MDRGARPIERAARVALSPLVPLVCDARLGEPPLPWARAYLILRRTGKRVVGRARSTRFSVESSSSLLPAPSQRPASPKGAPVSRPLTAPLGSGSRVVFGVAPAQGCPGVGAVALRAGRQGDHRLDAELVVAVGAAVSPGTDVAADWNRGCHLRSSLCLVERGASHGAIARKRVGLVGAGIGRPWLTRS